MTHVAESTHWYARDGSPCYTVKAKDGTDRPTTLRDARKMNLVPSVTSIIRCAAAPGLDVWKQNQVLLAALTLSRRHGESEERYIARIMEDSKEQARKAADRGTAIHAAIQGHFEGQTPPEEYWPHVKSAVAVLGLGDWVPERSFANPAGFGGKVDLCSINPPFVCDFKTKEFSPDDQLRTWDEHSMQLAAYREGLLIPDAACAIVYVSTTVPGLARLIEIEQEDLQKGWQMFQGLLAYWRAKCGYDPAFEEAVAA